MIDDTILSGDLILLLMKLFNAAKNKKLSQILA